MESTFLGNFFLQCFQFLKRNFVNLHWHYSKHCPYIHFFEINKRDNLCVPILCPSPLAISHINVNLPFKEITLLFFRLLPCVSKMFIFREKWHQVRDPESQSTWKGWNLARKFMKRYDTHDLI